MIANSICQIKDVPTSIIATVNEKVIANGFDKILKILCRAIKKKQTFLTVVEKVIRS